MNRKAEILAVKQLGELIGYGNIMDIASALWAISLDKSIGYDGGAFVPVVIDDVNSTEQSFYKNRKNSVKKDIANNIN